MVKTRGGARTTARRRTISEDLISKLPDDVLTQILSYLPTKSSVETSVLSKRWSRLWIQVPNLDFSFCNFSCPVRRAQFENFMDRFLSLNTFRSVRKINFQLEMDYEVSRLNAWLAAFGDRDAVKVDLNSYVDKSYSPIYSLPDTFFVQNNLVKLNLTAVVLNVPLLVCFPKLEKMTLIQVKLLDETSMKNLLCGSPLLKTLTMYLGDEGDNVQTLHICSTSLRDLILRVVNRTIHLFDVVIDSPNLTFLSLTDFGSSTFNIINASLLESVYLHIESADELLKLLAKITHVTELHIFMSVLYILDTFYASLPMLPNLIHLTAEVYIDYDEEFRDGGLLSSLLDCTPNIVTFSIMKDCSKDIGDWLEQYEVPQCFLSSIESVKIKWVRDVDHDLQMIAYILKNAMVLNKLSIYCDRHDLVNETEFLTTLLTLPRSSTTCQVKYKNRIR